MFHVDYRILQLNEKSSPAFLVLQFHEDKLDAKDMICTSHAQATLPKYFQVKWFPSMHNTLLKSLVAMDTRSKRAGKP